MGPHLQSINWGFTYGCSNLFSCHFRDDENVKQKINLEGEQVTKGPEKGEEEV